VARPNSTKTHLENLVIIGNTAHGEVTSDPVFAIYALNADPLSPGTAVFTVDDLGNVAYKGALTQSPAPGGDVVSDFDAITISGGYVATSGTGLSIAATGALTSNSTGLFEGAVTSGILTKGGSFVAVGVTSGGITIAPIAGSNNGVTTIINSAPSAASITLPAATCTLPGIGLDNAFTGVNSFDVDGNAVAAGENGLSVWIGQANGTALTGTLRGAYIQAVNGTAAASGTVRGIECKAKSATGAALLAGLTGIYISADPKNGNTTAMRGLEVSLDGDSGGTATTVQGIVIFNNSSGTQTTSYALDINGGTASGHKVFTTDIRLQNGETIDNSTDGTLNLTATTVKATGILDVTGNATLVSLDVGGGYSGGSGSTLATTGTGLFAAANATTNTWVRTVIGEIAASGTGMTASYGAAGLRGLVTVTGTATGQAYFYGTQGKLTTSTGSFAGGCFAAALVGQLDVTGATTYTSVGCMSALWLDAGTSAHANAVTAKAMFNLAQFNNTCVGLVMNSALKVQGYFTYLLELKDGDGGSGNYLAGGARGDASGSLSSIKIKTPDGDRYIALYD
jgi:hypothetical protein